MSNPQRACPLKITQKLHDCIKDCEAVVIREFEQLDGSRMAMIVDWGDKEQLEKRRFDPYQEFIITPAGYEWIADHTILVEELEKPSKEDYWESSIQSP